ncbi:MAG: Asp-tRNA(Asn)/Glu-tRNA(Gln) amidotransferase subunit GatB [Deltaproteobacteria bacterium]|nr:Asp-tRNA(Asn)/Glu-tRNA(Gln) amidotransferase subunit GatB [Deltaproteobacteria bacterium]
MNYETVIGLEVHAQLLTKTKLFCSCSTEFGKKPNHNTCPVCLGLPGVLPVLNRCVVEFAIRAGLATNCSIAPKSVFARKNYFYPDLPKGYQISQYELPICQKGFLDVEVEGQKKRIGMTRIHIEEDAGKLVHEHPETRAKDASWVDLNRAGVPLIEIVSEPDMRSATEAVAYMKKLRTLLVYIGVSDGNMEEGSLRCDANVSLRPVGQEKFGTRAELTNINSFRNVERAILHEVDRQKAILEEGGKIVQETRLWDADKGCTYSMRSKEEANDYRYFPDPDLLPLVIEEAWIEKVQKELPELPEAKKVRFIQQFQLPPADAETLTSARGFADFFEACVEKFPQAKKVANWVVNEFLRMIKADELLIPKSPLKPSHVAETLQMIEDGKISGSAAKAVLQKVFETGKSPTKVVEEEGLAQVSDEGALEKTIDEIVAANPKEVERYKAGNDKLIGFFVGQVMKQTGGRANPAKVNELVKKKIG